MSAVRRQRQWLSDAADALAHRRIGRAQRVDPRPYPVRGEVTGRQRGPEPAREQQGGGKLDERRRCHRGQHNGSGGSRANATSP